MTYCVSLYKGFDAPLNWIFHQETVDRYCRSNDTSVDTEIVDEISEIQGQPRFATEEEARDYIQTTFSGFTNIVF